MHDRATITFQVSTGEGGGQRWLTADGTMIPDQGKAASFTLHRSPTGMERLRITRTLHEILGDGNEATGHREYAALRLAVEGMRETVRQEIREQIGPKPATGDTEIEQWEKRFAEVASEQSSESSIMADDLSRQADDLFAMARWAVLVKDVPTHFIRLDSADVPDHVVLALRLAWWKAEEDSAAGKG